LIAANPDVSRLFVALIHFPVLDRRGKIVSAAVTSLDIHDIARAARTYEVDAAFIVHPIEEQRAFAERVLEHWRFDYGREFDSRRREALELMRVVSELDEAIDTAERAAGRRPLLVYTSAREREGISYAELRDKLESSDSPPLMIMLGTGFGLAPSMKERADMILAPLRGPGEYNHLSVRSAASIILDRLRGRRENSPAR
jgi:hypothetical protein